MTTFKNIISKALIAATIIGGSITANVQQPIERIFNDAEQTYNDDERTYHDDERTYHDAEMYNLIGHVKECATFYEGGVDTISFCSFRNDGHVIIDNKLKITRDNSNRIIMLQEDSYDEYNEKIVQTFEWGGDLVIYRDWQKLDSNDSILSIAMHYYTFDEDGLISDSYYSSRVYSETSNYTYLEVDDHGNWTKRRVKRNPHFKGEEPFIETRTITYYE